MNEGRRERLHDRLIKGLQPTRLEIRDDSHKHIGHAGAKDGKAHFFVLIECPKFKGLTPIQMHKMVYEAVGDLMQTDIHALQIDARP